MYTKILLLITLLVTCCYSIAQNTDSTTKTAQLSGSLGVTNNGISLIPTFTLEKPAALSSMSLSKNRFSFDPELTFSLSDGKPWYFLLWLRYKIADTEKFKFTAGTHLGLNFKRTVLPVDGDSIKALLTQRYLVGELAPNYFVSKNTSVGIYYLLSHGLDAGTANLTHFLTLNANFSNIKLNSKFYMKIMPQFYYLNIDNKDGFYYTSSFTLAKNNFPLSFSTILNKSIKTNIDDGRGFVWNVSLSYAFNKKYLKSE